MAEAKAYQIELRNENKARGKDDRLSVVEIQVETLKYLIRTARDLELELAEA